MFRALVVLASIVGASAFAPAARSVRSSSSLKMGYESEPGVLAPTGFFDPLGLTKDIDDAKFAQYRTAEIKHGRVCQLAVLGYVFPEFIRFPGEIAPGVSFASIPNGLAAIEAVPALGWFQMLFLIGYVDYSLTTKGSAEPFTNKKGFKEFVSKEFEDKAITKELQSGRLAMLAVLELLRHDSQMLVGGMYPGDKLITGLPFLYQ